MSQTAKTAKKPKVLDPKKRNGIILITLFALVGVAMLVSTKAATPTANLYLTPATGSYDISTNFTVGVFVNSGSELINAVGPQLTYDATKLEFVSVDTNGGAFPDCFDNAGGNGKVTLNCGKRGNPLSGSQKIGNITFKAKVGSGSTQVQFASGSVVYKGDAENIWDGNTNGGSYGLTTPDTTPPTVSITTPTNGTTVKDTVSINASASDASGIAKVEFWVNNVLKSTDTTSPYSYAWDSASLPDAASYPITVKAYDKAPAGNVGTATVNVKVQNNKPNLVVSSVSLVPANPKPGDLVTFSAIVTNNGTAATASGVAVTTDFSVGSTIIGSPTDSTALAVGASRTFTSTWTATLGTHTVTVTADKSNVVVETNEADNTKAQSFAVLKPGDANNDGKIDLADYSVLSNNWGRTGVTLAQGDFNGDGKVDLADYSILSNNWGK